MKRPSANMALVALADALLAKLARFFDVPTRTALARLSRHFLSWSLTDRAYILAIKARFVTTFPIFSAQRLKWYRVLNCVLDDPEAPEWFL